MNSTQDLGRGFDSLGRSWPLLLGKSPCKHRRQHIGAFAAREVVN
jgi:hypothetical protein